MRLLLLRFDAEIRVRARPVFARERRVPWCPCDPSGRAVGGEEQAKAGSLQGAFVCSGRAATTPMAGPASRDTTIRVARAGWRAFACPAAL